jgi:hypothetical protein
MRYVIGISILAALGWLAMQERRSENDAARVMAKAVAMEQLVGEEGAQVGYAVVSTRFPFSANAFEARQRLFELRARPDAADESLRDALWIRGDPHVGGLTLLALAALLALHVLLESGSRARGRAFLLLAICAAAIALTQTAWGHRILAEEGAAAVYAALPWTGAGAAALGALLLFARPRTSADHGNAIQSSPRPSSRRGGRRVRAARA